ncbi:hypothetical protein D9M70_584760 [compost metagenome]
MRRTRRTPRCFSRSATLRLTVASGACNRRAPAERLPASTTASSTDIASNRSIGSFRKLRGKFLKWQDTLLVSDILAFVPMIRRKTSCLNFHVVPLPALFLSASSGED